MEAISKVISFVGVLVFSWSAVGIVYPGCLRRPKTLVPPVSRIDFAILACLTSLPFLFVANLFRTAAKFEGFFAFLAVSTMIIGPFAFYFWGLRGVRNYLYHQKRLFSTKAVLIGVGLAVFPVMAFFCMLFSAIITHVPGSSWIGQIAAFVWGMCTLVLFKKIFRVSFLGGLSAYFEAYLASVDEENEENPTSGPKDSRGWLFSFMYTEDDGLLNSVKAVIYSANQNERGEKYLHGVCTQTSAPRYFWLRRILGTMTGPMTEQSDGEVRDANLVFEELLGHLSEPEYHALSNIR